MKTGTLITILITLAGCGGGGNGTVDAGDGGKQDMGTALDAGGDGGGGGDDAGMACMANSKCEGTVPAGRQCVTTVTARLLAEDGKPVAGLPMSLCDKGLCLNGTTDAAGVVLFAPCRISNAPAFKLVDDPNWANFGTRIPDQPGYDYHDVKLTAMPKDGSILPKDIYTTGKGTIDMATTFASGPVSLQVAASTNVEVQPYVKDDQTGQFRAAEMTNPPPGVDPALKLAQFIAMGPAETKFDPPAAFTIQNTKGWAAGTMVEFFLNGLDITDKPVPYGGWGSIGTGVVSSDGKTITPDKGVGLSTLAIVGIRKK